MVLTDYELSAPETNLGFLLHSSASWWWQHLTIHSLCLLSPPQTNKCTVQEFSRSASAFFWQMIVVMEVSWTMSKEKNQNVQNSFAYPWLIGFILYNGNLLSFWFPAFSITLFKRSGMQNRKINTLWLANIF